MDVHELIRRLQAQLITIATRLDRRDKKLAAAIQALAETNAAQTAALTALANRLQRATTTIGPLGAGSTTDVPITWPETWPDTGYMVEIELICGPLALGSLHKTLKVGSKTTTGCTVTVSAAQAVASVGVDVLGVRT